MILNTWGKGSSPEKAYKTPVQNKVMTVTAVQNKALNP